MVKSTPGFAFLWTTFILEFRCREWQVQLIKVVQKEAILSFHSWLAIVVHSMRQRKKTLEVLFSKHINILTFSDIFCAKIVPFVSWWKSWAVLRYFELWVSSVEIFGFFFCWNKMIVISNSNLIKRKDCCFYFRKN